MRREDIYDRSAFEPVSAERIFALADAAQRRHSFAQSFGLKTLVPAMGLVVGSSWLAFALTQSGTIAILAGVFASSGAVMYKVQQAHAGLAAASIGSAFAAMEAHRVTMNALKQMSAHLELLELDE